MSSTGPPDASFEPSGARAERTNAMTDSTISGRADRTDAATQATAGTTPGIDFVALQVPDLDVAAAFYRDVVELPPAPQSPPAACLFATEPIAFAVREPLGELPEPHLRGRGVALWLGVPDVPALRGRLLAAGAEIVTGPAPSPFGSTLVFRDPDGYLITAHERTHGTARR